MSVVDNITFALVSLKKELEDYLDKQRWKRLYRIFIFGDSFLKNKEIVLDKSSRNQIELPLIIIDTGSVRNEIQEIGSEFGRDSITLSLIVMAKEENQLRTLSNLIRRKVSNFSFDIKNYDSARRETLGTGEMSEVVMLDVSDPNANNVADRYVAVINSTLEIDAEAFV